MYLKSVSLQNNCVSVVTFIRRTDNVIIPYDIWRSSPDSFDYVKEVQHDVDLMQPATVIVNPDKHSPADSPTSSLKRSIERELTSGLRVFISPRFEIAQGLAAFQFLKKDHRIVLDGFSEWQKLEAELNRLEQNQSAAALAFLQGCIHADEKLRRSTGRSFGMRLAGGRRSAFSGWDTRRL